MLEISFVTKNIVPKIPFGKIKNFALGKDYDLSLVFCGNAFSKRLNPVRSSQKKSNQHLATKILKHPSPDQIVKYFASNGVNRRFHKKNSPANVLTFPLDKKTGEIFINLALAKREAIREKTTFRNRVLLLYTHALGHLRGLPHGRKMERFEQSKKFRM